MNDNQGCGKVILRAQLWKRVLRRPLCWFGFHRLVYYKGGRVYANWQDCVYCGHHAWLWKLWRQR